MASHSRAGSGPAATPREMTAEMEPLRPRWLRVPITRGQSRHFLRVLTRLTSGDVQQLANDEQEETMATLIGIAVTARDAIWHRGVPFDEPILAAAVTNFADLIWAAVDRGSIDVEDAAFVWETLDWGDDGGRDPNKSALLRRTGHRWIGPTPEDPGTGSQA